MKILVYAGNGGSGGLKGYIKGFLSACYIDSNVEVVVICMQQLADYVKGNISNNVRLIVTDKCGMKLSSYIKGNKLSPQVKRFIDNEKPDIVYFMSSIIPKGTEKYINVIGMHNQLYIDKSQLHRQWLSKTFFSLYIQRHFVLASLKKANAVVFDSNQSMQQCISAKKAFKKGIIAYFGVEEDERNNVLHQKELKNPIELLYVSTIFPYKNQMDLIEGISELKNRGYNLKLHLVGSGPEKYTQELKEKIDFFNLTKEVVLHSWIEHSQVKKMIDDTDIFIYASSIETSGFGLMEGMVRGAVIACNNESCMPEILEDGGLLFNVHDKNNTADILECLINNPNLRQNLSAKSLEVSEIYTWEKHTSIIFENFRRLLNE
jgi:glycosyltransferase involved in cell wall biosynthesis